MYDYLRGHGWQLCTADTLVTVKTAVLYAVILLVSTDGGDVSIYEGQDAISGRLISTFKANANSSKFINLYGLRCERGIYVDIGSNVTSCLVVFDHVYELEGIAEVQLG